MALTLHVSDFGTLPDGRLVKEYRLANARGVRVTLLDYGAMLAAVELPDRSGRSVDVTHGYDDLAGWMADTTYFGANVGRFANRIAGGKFSLDGKPYSLATNNEPAGQPCHLHGGPTGFHKRLWSGRPVEKTGARGVEFSYVSADGEEGYPGTLTVTLTYWLTEQGELTLFFRATTDKATIVNLTNHVYWNLSGDPGQPITGHEIQIDADELLPVSSGLIPTGKPMPVAGTPFDFTQPALVGARIGDEHEQLKFGNGYDHCWVLRKTPGLRRAARVVEPTSGRVIELWSDQPGMQLYTGNFLDGAKRGKAGARYPFRSAFCLEPQRFPDAPNQPQFPSAMLRPGEVYSHELVYRFSTL